jgi:DNA-binding MarR family transcriptional regulator
VAEVARADATHEEGAAARAVGRLRPTTTERAESAADGDGARARCYTSRIVSSRFEESILISIRRMSRAVDLQSRQLAKAHDLTGPQLVCLRRMHTHEGLTPKSLAAAVSLSQATVTGILDRLERRGLVRRVRSTVDKRVVHLEVTPDAVKLIGEAPSPLSERFRGRLGALPEGEQAMIDWVLRRVVDMMEAGEVDASPILTTGDVTAEPSDVTRFFEGEPED